MKTSRIAISLTNICNLRCRMCGSQRSRAIRGNASMKMLKRALDGMIDHGVVTISATGEHTTHPHFMDFVEEIRSRDLGLRLTTNGHWPWALGETAEFGRMLDSMCFSEVNFSLDAAQGADYRWLRGRALRPPLDHLRALIASTQRCGCGVAYIAMRRNLRQTIPLMKLVPGLRQFFLNILLVNSEDMLDETLYDIRDEYTAALIRTEKFCSENGIKFSAYCDPRKPTFAQGCKYPNMIWIDWEGFVHPCCRHPATTFGNVLEEPLEAILERGALRLPDVHRSEICAPCFAPEDPWPRKLHFETDKLYELWRKRQM